MNGCGYDAPASMVSKSLLFGAMRKEITNYVCDFSDWR